MKNNISLYRRVLTLIAVVGASLALLAVGATSASADPSVYPPQNTCSSSSTGGGGNSLNSGAGSQCRGVNNESDSRDPSTSTTRNETETASTGFETLSASLIAAALLVGGGFLLVAGRRRRHS